MCRKVQGLGGGGKGGEGNDPLGAVVSDYACVYVCMC